MRESLSWARKGGSTCSKSGNVKYQRHDGDVQKDKRIDNPAYGGRVSIGESLVRLVAIQMRGSRVVGYYDVKSFLSLKASKVLLINNLSSTRVNNLSSSSWWLVVQAQVI
jgi:hypothetical protein